MDCPYCLSILRNGFRIHYTPHDRDNGVLLEAVVLLLSVEAVLHISQRDLYRNHEYKSSPYHICLEDNLSGDRYYREILNNGFHIDYTPHVRGKEVLEPVLFE
jgi:hypothetical protein